MWFTEIVLPHRLCLYVPNSYCGWEISYRVSVVCSGHPVGVSYTTYKEKQNAKETPKWPLGLLFMEWVEMGEYCQPSSLRLWGCPSPAERHR